MKIAGIDWSMRSPSICIADSEAAFCYKSCRIHFFSKKADNTIQLFPYDPLEEWNCQEERFHVHANWALDVLWSNRVKKVVIEGYAFGSSSGLVFNIGESTGALKGLLWRKNIEFIVAPPTVIKKFATGKGNSNKLKLMEQFEKESNHKTLKQELHETEKQNNPSSDIIDSYFMCKWLWTKEKLLEIENTCKKSRSNQ